MEAFFFLTQETWLVRRFALFCMLLGEASASPICPRCDPREIGDFVHRDSLWDAAFVGHTGLFVDEIVDVAVGRRSGKALARISLEKFKKGGSYWGAKMLREAPRHDAMSADERVLWRQRILDKISFFERTGVDYDVLHLTQKGGRSRDGHFVFDCVGFTEHLWEYLGYDPTPAAFESGLGWPLTVREQRDSPRLEHVRS